VLRFPYIGLVAMTVRNGTSANLGCQAAFLEFDDQVTYGDTQIHAISVRIDTTGAGQRHFLASNCFSIGGIWKCNGRPSRGEVL
jgi:hypothetical protein